MRRVRFIGGGNIAALLAWTFDGGTGCLGIMTRPALLNWSPNFRIRGSTG